MCPGHVLDPRLPAPPSGGLLGSTRSTSSTARTSRPVGRIAARHGQAIQGPSSATGLQAVPVVRVVYVGGARRPPRRPASPRTRRRRLRGSAGRPPAEGGLAPYLGESGPRPRSGSTTGTPPRRSRGRGGSSRRRRREGDRRGPENLTGASRGHHRVARPAHRDLRVPSTTHCSFPTPVCRTTTWRVLLTQRTSPGAWALEAAEEARRGEGHHAVRDGRAVLGHRSACSGRGQRLIFLANFLTNRLILRRLPTAATAAEQPPATRTTSRPRRSAPRSSPAPPLPRPSPARDGRRPATCRASARGETLVATMKPLIATSPSTLDEHHSPAGGVPSFSFLSKQNYYNNDPATEGRNLAGGFGCFSAVAPTRYRFGAAPGPASASRRKCGDTRLPAGTVALARQVQRPEQHTDRSSSSTRTRRCRRARRQRIAIFGTVSTGIDIMGGIRRRRINPKLSNPPPPPHQHPQCGRAAEGLVP